MKWFQNNNAKDIKTLPNWNSKFGMQDVAPCILNWLMKVNFHKLKVKSAFSDF